VATAVVIEKTKGRKKVCRKRTKNMRDDFFFEESIGIKWHNFKCTKNII